MMTRVDDEHDDSDATNDHDDSDATTKALDQIVLSRPQRCRPPRAELGGIRWGNIKLLVGYLLLVVVITIVSISS